MPKIPYLDDDDRIRPQHGPVMYAVGVIGDRPAAGDVPPGYEWKDSATGDITKSDGTTWEFRNAGARSSGESTSYLLSGGIARAVFTPLTVVGPVAFSLAESSSRIVVPAPGRYLVTAKATVTQIGASAEMCIVNGDGAVLLSSAVHNGDPSVSGIVTIGGTTGTSKFSVDLLDTDDLSAFAVAIDVQRFSA